jgi:hypothetical protein
MSPHEIAGIALAVCKKLETGNSASESRQTAAMHKALLNLDKLTASDITALVSERRYKRNSVYRF